MVQTILTPRANTRSIEELLETIHAPIVHDYDLNNYGQTFLPNVYQTPAGKGTPRAPDEMQQVEGSHNKFTKSHSDSKLALEGVARFWRPDSGNPLIAATFMPFFVRTPSAELPQETQTHYLRILAPVELRYQIGHSPKEVKRMTVDSFYRYAEDCLTDRFGRNPFFTPNNISPIFLIGKVPHIEHTCYLMFVHVHGYITEKPSKHIARIHSYQSESGPSTRRGIADDAQISNDMTRKVRQVYKETGMELNCYSPYFNFGVIAELNESAARFNMVNVYSEPGTKLPFDYRQDIFVHRTADADPAKVDFEMSKYLNLMTLQGNIAGAKTHLKKVSSIPNYYQLTQFGQYTQAREILSIYARHGSHLDRGEKLKWTSFRTEIKEGVRLNMASIAEYAASEFVRQCKDLGIRNKDIVVHKPAYLEGAYVTGQQHTRPVVRHILGLNRF